MSETMGFYGFWNRTFPLNDNFFITAGAFVIPFTGGAGAGYRHSFNNSRISPFISTSTFGIYAIPIMCGTDNCETKTDLAFSGSAGFDIHAIRNASTPHWQST